MTTCFCCVLLKAHLRLRHSSFPHHNTIITIHQPLSLSPLSLSTTKICESAKIDYHEG
ncbi:hypothetical protein AXX17_AT1G00210 [Arabidopsis thaliana]|uniref:Uncharacterized protein n=1 Tax=Arabidopsis thaliana TaxID=3702 RepID=A0A178WL49_ARATH|nr:hypothetical protein AXX17_AT1G00210 [Arabidopsis thaliana]